MALDQSKSSENGNIENTWWAIYSFHEYKMCHEWTNRKNKRIEKLEILEMHLIETESEITDPIQYLHMLYFGWSDKPRMSVPALWRETKDIWLAFADPDGLHKMIKSFGWELHPNTQLTEAGRATLLRNESNKKTIAENLVKFNNALISLMGEDHEDVSNNFDLSYYLSIWKPIDKALYLLNLRKQDIGSISSISELKWQAVMTALNTKLQEIIQWLRLQWFEIEDLRISKWSINHLLSKFKSDS